jgi:uncharacterized protein with ParB-like and HNH nuclease domain
MKPSIQTLGQILNSPSQYVIPVFQRNYRWDASQWEKLWESLVEIQDPQKRGNHFMGFLVFVPGIAQPGQHTTFHLIDGQQRLTTMSIFLTAIRNVARDLLDTALADEVHNSYLVHPHKRNDEHYRLLPKERDHDSYLALVTGGTEQPTGRMADALEYYEQRLVDREEEQPGALRQYFETTCRKLEFMCATLEAENAYNIFKSLNSTGVPLGSSDLIRNFTFMHLAPEEHDDFDRELWQPLENRFLNETGTLDEDQFSRFFRDFLMSSGKYVSPRETFATFEARYEATGFSPRSLGLGLSATAADYAIISGEERDQNETVSVALSRLNALESSTTYPLLLSLFAKRREGRLTTEQLVEAVDMLRGFILRRFVCGDTSRGYGQMFVRAIRDHASPVEDLRAYLLNRGWPDDHRFEEAFIKFPLYQRGYTRAILEAIERSRGHKEPADLALAQVEHVMPQTLSDDWVETLGANAEAIHADWLHTAGNLTLSGYNQELWNHPFEIKRARYASSNVVLTRELSDFSTWTNREISERGRKLAKEAIQLWIGPKEHFVRLDDDAEDDTRPDRRELRSKFWTGFDAYRASQHPELPDFEPRPVWGVRLPSGIRHIGIDMRFSLKHQNVAVDIWFWREASRPVWEKLRAAPDQYNEIIGGVWEFEPVEGRHRARMTLSWEATDLRDETNWPGAYAWLAEKLTVVYGQIAPRLRAEMEQIEPEAEDVPADDQEAGSATQDLQERYWTAFNDTLGVKGGLVAPKKPQRQHYMTYPIGRSGFHLNAVLVRAKQRVRVELYISGALAKAYLSTLQLQRTQIESELGYPLEWQDLPKRRDCRICRYLDEIIVDMETDWPRQHDWLIARLNEMHRVFAERVRMLDASAPTVAPEETSA